MQNSFALPILALALVMVLLPNAVAQDPMPAQPDNFDSSAKLPPNLPTTINIPSNTRIDVKCWRKTPLPRSIAALPPDQNPRLLWSPDLQSALIERAQKDIHAVYHWEGNRTSEAFVIKGLCFSMISFARPNLVIPEGAIVKLWLAGEYQNAGASGDFPGILWYSPSCFAGTASASGTAVLVFTPEGKKKANTSASGNYPDGASLCLDPKTFLPVYLDNGAYIYTFAYSPDPNVQINPQGMYLKAIETQFGHYP